MLKRSSKQMEMVVGIYESADGVRGHKPDPEGTDTKGDPDTAPHTGGDTAWSRWSKLIAVCLVVLCVVLLTAVIGLSIKYNNLKTSNNNQTTEEQLQKKRDELQKFLKEGWTYFNSSVYYSSTEEEKKSWTESRQNCRQRGADLVIITSTEEQKFISKLTCKGTAWIGLSGKVRENKWKWVDDTPLSTEFWGPEEPNGKSQNEDCVVTGDKADPVRNWADYNCNNMFMWICEKTISN